MASTNLPVQLTTFIGRKRELAELERLLSTSRLVTLVGAGGCGKTRLALQVAKTMSARVVDGVWLVELASLHDPTLIPQFIMQSLHIASSPEMPALDTILTFVQSKQMLLVLDNCEHLIGACAELAQHILMQSPKSKILATSREPLFIPGESVFYVPGLDCPSADTRLADNPQDYLRYDAVNLFVERLRLVSPGFNLTASDAPSIVQICRRLDGLPLALELASARSNVLTLQQIAERLDDRFTLLFSRQRSDVDPRHQTLRSAIDWSHDLLALPEQVLLRRQSVFEGGCSLATVEEVCSGDGVERGQILDLLSSLVEKSLVAAQTYQRGEARYSLLETIRQYAQEKLVASGELPALRDRHLQCCLRLMEEAVPKLSGPYQQLWLNWLEGEYDNLRAAFTWSLESGRIEAGLRIAIAIYQFWTIRDYAEEGLTWMSRLLSQAGEGISPVIHANALAYAVFLAGFRGNTTEQIAYGQKAALLAGAVGEQDKLALRWALAAQAYAARAAGDYQAQFDIGKRVIRLNRELGDRYQLGLNLSINSFAAMSLGKYDEARAMLDEALTLLREVGNPYRIAMALNFSGDLARLEQNYTRAQTMYEESVSLLRELDAPRDLASALQNLGHTCLHLGDVECAHALLDESLLIQVAQRNTPGIAECLIGFAAVAITNGLTAAGARLLAASVKIGGKQIASTWAATQMEYEYYFALAHQGLAESEFQVEQAAGSAFSLEEAIAYAQNLPIIAATPAHTRTPNDLTLREREIVGLIALGKSNGEIAQELVVSKRTIEKHIAHIILKLGVTNRAQIVRWAFETGMVKSTG